MKRCEVCNREYEPRNNRQRFCTKKCEEYFDYNKPRQKKCVNCGNIFTGNKSAIYCSKECKKNGINKNKRIYKHKCIVCSKEFESKAYHSKYCSYECKKVNSKQKQYIHKCVVCNNEYSNTVKESKYCSTICKVEKQYKENSKRKILQYNKWLQERGFKQEITNRYKKKNKINSLIVKCNICNEECEITEDYLERCIKGERKYLGCKNCYKDIRHNIYSKRVVKGNANKGKEPCKKCGKYTQLNQDGLCIKCKPKETRRCTICNSELTNERTICKSCKEEKKKKELEIKYSKKYICQYCGEIYHMSDNWKGKKYCSIECRNKKENKSKEIKRRTRLITNGEYDDTITLKKLYKKYNGVCQICGKKCDYEDYVITEKGVHIAGNMYPSIDHMIPLAKGGTHTDNNVQLAHRICNSIKSSNIIEEIDGQMRFF